MDINKFIEKREFLYHLTDRRNFKIIHRNGIMLSTKSIVDQSNLSVQDRLDFVRNRRPVCCIINVNDTTYHIRDQRPISLKNLSKCLTNGLNVGDFIQILNNRVFFWPTVKRLQSHYNRYADDNPLIIRVPTAEFLAINLHTEFCRLNSGATRSNCHHNGAPPERGLETFLPANLYDNSIGSVAEVTFPSSCQLCETFHIGYSPNGPWTLKSINQN